MFEHIKIQNPDDFFIELENRQSRGVYFYRINGYNEQIGEFIKKYYEAARIYGGIIEGRIANPDEKNLSYYSEIMGMDFQMSTDFIVSSLKKWLPRMNEYQRNAVAVSVYKILESMKEAGKNENILKNAYIKFMCWLYYKVQGIVNQLGDNQVPKVLYEGTVNSYELMLLEILSRAGCDVVLIQYGGDIEYHKLDPNSEKSDVLNIPNMEEFPEGFSIRNIMNTERLYGRKSEILNCTNAWIAGNGLEDFKTSIQNRGDDPKLFYNCYYRMNGVEDKLTYLNELYQFQLELKNSGRRVVIVEQKIAQPTPDEIDSIKRQNYGRQEDMIMDLCHNIEYSSNAELQRIMVRSFIDVVLEESERAGMSLNKLTNRAVILLCWLKRYREQLFHNWRMPDISCFIYMGGCTSEKEAMFIRFLARLPIDVLILNPNLNNSCCLQDKLLFEVNYVNSLAVDKFPQEDTGIQIGTAAYYAERELDEIMYQDSGMYRNHQYAKAASVTLQTMYEEIPILWNQELKYRPNFSTIDNIVNMPVIFAKVSGVKDGEVQSYWAGIKTLLTEDTFLIKDVPFINTADANPVKAYATEFFKNGKIQKEKIKNHSAYQYGVLRDEIQEHILEKLQLLIDKRLIKGTFENGTEYTIVATVLNLRIELIRLIQKFDFTKKNPKVVYVNTTESNISLEDSILAAFLNLVGFDVIFFVPTGYQSVEKYFNKKLPEEHQLGGFIYDLQTPDLHMGAEGMRVSWWNKIFKRGT